jgi:Ca2+-binding EF-hand superfamily protein
MAQFARVLTIVGLPISQAALDVLCSVFQSSKDPSRINYRPFLVELSREQSTGKYNEEEKEAYGSNGFAPLSHADSRQQFTKVEDLLQDLQIFLRERRNILSISEPFEDFDKLRHARITVGQFRRCLHIFGYPFTSSDISLLVERYNTDNDNTKSQQWENDRAVIYVCYRKFLSDLIAGFVPTFEALATVTLESTKKEPLRYHKSRKLTLATDEIEFTEQLVEELAYVCNTRRISVKSQFVPYDADRHGRITERQFCSVLTAMFPMHLSPTAMKLLSTYFSDSETEVNYVSFCHAIQSNESTYEEVVKNSFVSEYPEEKVTKWQSRAEPKSFFISTTPVSQTEINQLLASLRRTISTHRLNLDEIFVNFDPLRRGTVNASRFRRCIHASGIRLTEPELKVLEAYYSEKDDFVNFKRLLSDLSEIPKL